MTATTHITIHTNACCGENIGGGGLVVAPTPPTPMPPSTGAGNVWWNSDTGCLFVWTGSEWVEATCCGGSSVTVAPTPPDNPGVGWLWWDTVGGQLYVWTGSEWVAASCCDLAGELTSVTTDATLTGKGTPASPLSVVSAPTATLATTATNVDDGTY